MLEPYQVAIIFAAVILVMFLAGNLKSGERANSIAKTYCLQREFQFLDGTVSLSSFSVCFRRPQGLVLTRNFRFDYSTNSIDRWRARLSLATDGVQTVQAFHDELDTNGNPALKNNSKSSNEIH